MSLVLMRESCQHCGEALPAIVDAFCSQCGEDLSEVAAIEAATADQTAELSPHGSPLFFYLSIVGFIINIILFFSKLE